MMDPHCQKYCGNIVIIIININYYAMLNYIEAHFGVGQNSPCVMSLKLFHGVLWGNKTY